MTNPLEELALEQLQRRTSMKWATHPPDVLPLWVAEMDVRPAPAIVRAVKRAMDVGDTGYPSGSSYAEALADFAAERWSWSGLAVERTAIVPDVMVGVVEAMRLITRPQDAVVVCPPVYAPFYACVAHAGRRIVEAPLGPDYRLSLENLEAAFRRACQVSARPLLLLANPHNPTGTTHTRDELTAVAALSRRFGVRVISDEIHAPVVLGGAEFVPYLSVAGSEDAFVVHSASKGWNLAGLKAALLVAGPEAEQDLARLPEEISHGPSHVGVLAHTAALMHGRGWLDDVLEGLDRNRTLLADLLTELTPDLELTRPEATYLAWIDCRRLQVHQNEARSKNNVVSDVAGPARLFLSQARVALSSGHVFGTGGAGYVRLNFATSATILRSAIERMAAAIEFLRVSRTVPG